MKKIAKRGLLVLLTLALVISAFCISTFAAASQPQTYSKDSNSGTRDVVCTTLDGTSASSYYTSNYSYGTLSNQSSSALYTSLQTLMRSTHTYISSYDDCRDMAVNTDCENEDGSVSLIYTGYSATMSQYNGWNREHVWPQSSGGKNTTGGGADLHHIRPSDAGVNSSRGNKPYGESGSSATEKYGSNPAVGYLGGTYNSTYFEPNDNVKGDVARICLYVYVRWGSAWGADSITKVFQSVDVLLEWCEMDPVDTWEMGRNEVVEDIQGNRNVFIDYPEYAWLLFDREVPDDMTTPSGMARSGGTGTGSTGSGSTGGSTGGSTDGIVGAPAPETSTGSGATTTTTATISFRDAAHRVSQTTAQQVWTNGGITLTNNKTSNSSDVVADVNPAKFYAKSLVRIDGTSIQSILFTCSSSAYATALVNSLKNSYDATASGTNVTVTFETPVDSIEFNCSAQFRLYEMTVTCAVSASCQHSSTTTTTTPATCTTAGTTIITCNDCKEVVSTTTTTPATGHNYVSGVCSVCGHETSSGSGTEPTPTDPLGLVGKQFYIATQRTTSGNYFYMTSNLGTASTKRYQAVDSGLSTLPTSITTPAEGYVFGFVYNNDDTYSIFVVNGGSSNYLGHSSGNSGILVAASSALKLTVEYSNGTYTIHYASSDAERYLALNGTSGYNYFAFYKSGQKQNLSLIEVKTGCSHTSTTTTTINATCTTAGTTTVTCDNCDKIISSETIPATGHQNKTTTTVDATCTAAGSTTVTCDDCHTIISSETIPVKEHNYYNGVCKDCGHAETCPLDLSKEYNLFVTIDDVKYYVNGIVSGGAFGSSIKSAEAAVFKIESAGNDGEYLLAVKVSRDSAWKYVAIDTSKANGISLDEKANATVFNWSTEKEALVVSGTGRAISTTDGASFQNYTVDVNHVAASFENDIVEADGTPDYDVTFEFGANGDAEHSDGGNASVTYSEKNGVYMITIGGENFYLGARDAFGNSCLKLGSSTNRGTITFTVPDDVTYVIIRIAKYKDNTTKITVNGGDAITIVSSSDNGEYDEIKINTTENKNVTIEGYPNSHVAMINSITYKFDEYTPDAPEVEEDPNCPLVIGTQYVISSNINGWYYLALNSASNGLIGITDIKGEAAYFCIVLGNNPDAPYRIYTVIDGVKYYIKNTNENVYLTTNAADATAFLWNDEKSSLATEDGRRLAATTDGFKLYLNSSSWATLTLIENVPENEGENPNAPTLIVFPYDTNKEYNFFVTIEGVEYYVSGILGNNFKLTTNRAAAIAFTIEKIEVNGATDSAMYLISFYDASNNKQYVRITKDDTNAIDVTTDRSLATNFTWHTERETLYAPDYNRGFASYNGTNTEVLNSYATSNSKYAWVSYIVDDAEAINPPSPVDPDNPNGGNGGNEGGNTGGTETTTKTEITFEFGTTTGTSNKENNSSSSSYSETVDGYEDYVLDIYDAQRFFVNSYDFVGNPCIKLGNGSTGGVFSFDVPQNVTKVIFLVSGRQAKIGAIKITGDGNVLVDQTISTKSNNNEYTAVEVDTTRITKLTVQSYKPTDGDTRLIMASITFVIETTSSDGGSSSAPDTGYDCNTNGHIENENGYCKVCEVAIRTASLVLGSDLSFQFGVNVIDKNINTNGAYMKFFFDEKEIDVTNFKTNGDYIYFIFEGIAPNQMTLPITAVLYVNGKEAGRIENYSVEANLRGILAQTDDEVLKQLIHETLIYGYASQQYKPSGGKDVSIDGITSKNEEASVNDAMSLQGNKDGNVKITAVGVHFDRYNSYYIKVKITDTSLFGKVTVDGVEYGLNDMVKLSEEGEGLYQLYFGKVDATKFDTRVTVELYSSEGIVTRLVYSINAYVYAVQENYDDGSTMKTLAIALYNYGKAAEAYYNKYKPQD